MNSPKSIIPIFPLPIAVLPGEDRPLHIFEDRYKTLIRDCLARVPPAAAGGFGMPFFDPDRGQQVGSWLEITKTLNTYEDGRMDILVRGGRRFEVQKPLHPCDSYSRAEVSWIEDEDSDWDEKIANQVYHLHRKLITHVLGKCLPDKAYEGKLQLSFFIGASAALSEDQKFELLLSRNENERLVMLRNHLEERLPCLEQAIHDFHALREYFSVQGLCGEDSSASE